MSWDIVIGLEVHVQLLTQSKIFSSSPTQFGAKANDNASLIDLGLPGTLPVLNQAALHQAIKFGLAVGANINPTSVFERKNYFYPDLPKGYQLSQLEQPIVLGGFVAAPIADNPDNKVQLTRAHLEEDAGKSIHHSHDSAIDLNRAGTPLLEIVTEPCIDSIEEALSYLKQLHSLVQYLEICDGNMQEGSFRCDINLSIKPQGETKLGTRTEIKNMNSFRFIEKAMQYEIDRHMDVLESGGSIIQETRLFDDKTEQTRSMRSKEEANDYRYFPCPDLLPVTVSESLITEIEKQLPELPLAKLTRYQSDYGLSADDAKRLTSDKALADYFETVIEKSKAKPKMIANWVSGELLGYLNKHDLTINQSPIESDRLAELLDCICEQVISGKIAKQIFAILSECSDMPRTIIKQQGLAQIDNSDEIKQMINTLFADNAKQVDQYLSGKEKVFGFFVGQIMKQTQGKASPQTVTEMLKKAFEERR